MTAVATSAPLTLTAKEQTVLDQLVRAADENRPCPTQDDLLEALGCEGGVSSTVNIVQRLERYGLIEVERFQRSRRVRIVETGKWTAMPLNIAPHWRNRPKEVPAPSMSVIRAKRPDIAAEIFTRAAELGKPAVEYLADLVFVGWEVEKARG